MKSLIMKILLFLNYILMILFMGTMFHDLSPLSVQRFVPVFLATLFLADITFIASCNVKENTVLYVFCGLLAADSWYLLSAAGPENMTDLLFRLFSPVILYLSIKFCFLFIFQGYKYKLKKAADILLIILCTATVISMFFPDSVYFTTYGLQFAGSILCAVYIVLYHKERVLFVIRNEWKPILLSLMVTMAAFFIYYVTTMHIENHIGNFGVYIVVMIFSMSVHGIILKENNGVPLSAVFTVKQQAVMGIAGIGLICLTSIVSGQSSAVFFLMLNLFLALTFLCNIILGENLKYGNNKITQDSKYMYALEQLRHEEQLKAEFANFLHDDVLQDLLSVKNMTNKSHRPEVQDMIYETLDNLNIRIRNQMQDYHPVILKSLTLKENLTHLIDSIPALFPQRKIKVSFECSDTIFIAEPYDLLIYRLIKELLTNVYKHSDGDHAWITLALEKDIITLNVCDNGSQTAPPATNEPCASVLHKGLYSIKEQISSLGGSMSVSDNIPQGVRIEIQIVMKGDVSYKHFIS